MAGLVLTMPTTRFVAVIYFCSVIVTFVNSCLYTVYGKVVLLKKVESTGEN